MKLTLKLLLLFLVLNLSAQNNVSKEYIYDYVAIPEMNKLKAIRDSYVEITGLEEKYTDGKHKNGLPYHIYIPKNLKKGKKYPLVTFLHGYSDLTIDTHKGFPKGVWSLPVIQDKHPHILFIPRYRTFDDMWIHDDYRKMMMEALNDIIKELNKSKDTPNVDIDRLYITGFSQGGMGTWNFIKHYPNKFAAAAPLSGFFIGPQNEKEAKKIKHIPIWIFNGEKDKGVKGSRLSYQQLKKVKAKDVRYHEYEKQGHVIDDFVYFNKKFINWFFTQKKEL